MQTKLTSRSVGSVFLLAALGVVGATAVGCSDFYGLTERDSGAGAGGESNGGEPAATGARSMAGGADGQGGSPDSRGGQGAVGGEDGATVAGGAGGAGGAAPVDTSPVPILFDGPLGADRAEAVAPELDVRSEILVDGTASYATFELVSENELCVGTTLTEPEEDVWIILPFVEGSPFPDFDLAAHGITGFAFDVTSEPSAAELRFVVATRYLSSGYFFSAPVPPTPSSAELRLADLTTTQGPFTLAEPHFQEAANRLIWELAGTGTETVYRICISNVRVLRD